MTTARKTYLGTILAWLIVCVGYAAWSLATYRPSPIDGDFYAHNWNYQLIVFLVFRLPLWIVALFVVIGIEAIVLKRR